MSKRGSAFQGSKEDPGLDRDDGPEDTARRADSKIMSGRKIINPKSRRRPGGGGTGGADLSSIGNPFAPVDPNAGTGSASPVQFNSNPFNNVGFGSSAQSQSFPATNFGGNSQNTAPQSSSFPPSQNTNSNIFSNMNGGSSSFTFGGSGSDSNPFAKISQPAQQSPAPASTPKFNLFQSSQPQAPAAPSSIFGQQPTQNQQQPVSNPFAQLSTPNPANHAQSHHTSPNDMDMVSPPSSNKQSNPLAMFGQASSAASNAATPATSNLFGNLSKPTPSAPGGNPERSSSPFANSASKPAESPFMNSTKNIFGDLSKTASTPTTSTNSSTNLFTTSKPATESAPPLNFSAAGVGADESSGDAVTSPSSANLFGSTPKTSNSLFDRASNSSFGQNGAQSALPKSSSGGVNGTFQFGEVLADSQKGQGANLGSTSNSPSLFAPPMAQASPNKPTAPASEPAFGAATGATSAMQRPHAPSTGVPQQYRRINDGLRHVIMGLDPSSDWSDTLSGMLDAYKSSVARVRTSAGQPASGPSAPSFGIKRKEHADPPEDAPRAPKFPNNASTPSSQAPERTQSPLTQTPNKQQSETSKRIESIVEKGSQNGSSAPQGSLFSQPTRGGTKLFGNPSPQKQGASDASNGSIFDQNANSKTAFGGTSPQKSGNFSPAQGNLSYQQTSNGGLFGNSSTQKPSLFASSNADKRFSQTKTATPNNIFGNVSNANEVEEDEEGSEDDGTMENTMRNKSSAPPAGPSIFDRISRASPAKDSTSNSAASEDGSAANSANEQDGARSQLSEGDHTWKPEKPISFGGSVNTTSTPKVNGNTNNIFGTPKPTSSLFNFSTTPSGTPLKAPENNLFGGLKPPTTDESSRASTPGTEVNGVSASEAEGESSTQDGEVTNGEVMADKTSLTTEELNNEDVLYEVPKLKILQYGTKPGKEDEKEWRARGTGPFRVMKNKTTGKVRMLHRIAPRGTVLVNSSLFKNVVFKKASKGSIIFGATCTPEGKDTTMKVQQLMARMASDETAKELLKVLQDNKEE